MAESLFFLSIRLMKLIFVEEEGCRFKSLANVTVHYNLCLGCEEEEEEAAASHTFTLSLRRRQRVNQDQDK